MKPVITLAVIFLFSMSTWSQIPIDSVTGKAYFQKVLVVPDKDSAEIFALINLWAAESFKSSPDVIKLNDSNTQKMVVKGQMHMFSYDAPYNTHCDMNSKFTVKLEAKTGRVRVTINQINLYVSYCYNSAARGSGHFESPIEEYFRSEDQIRQELLSAGLGRKMTEKNVQEALEMQDKIRYHVPIKMSALISSLESRLLQSEDDDW
jgi:hypothetical protein